MIKTREQLMKELHVAKEKQDAGLSQRVLKELHKLHVVDPLEPCIGTTNVKMIIDTHNNHVLAWACVPKAKRNAALEALREGGKTVTAHVDATDGRETVMHLACLALAGGNTANYIFVLHTVTSTNARDKKLVVNGIHNLIVLEKHVQHLHSLGTALTEVNAESGPRASLIQIAVMAAIKANGPRSDNVNDLVSLLTEFYGDAAKAALSEAMMEKLMHAAA
ncbi:hypothetical protein [Paraburkholderia sp. C35]|uniref:hypothetical protein n=1 Tax=Paraburkholderia sp. C35 TaxID=2126993 RepID=UPI000D69FE08|nr:hypothetical protein [Paraburkholderia sp. C35]